MKISIDMDNLNEIIENAVPTNIEQAVELAIQDVVSTYINNHYIELIETTVNSYIEQHVRDYIHTKKIRVGGGLTSDDVQEVTVDEYVGNKLSSILKNKAFETTREDYFGSKKTERVTFEEFIKKEYDPTPFIKKELINFTIGFEREINAKIKTTFDNATRTTLSDAVFNILMSNDTYKNIQNSIERLTDGKE